MFLRYFDKFAQDTKVNLFSISRVPLQLFWAGIPQLLLHTDYRQPFFFANLISSQLYKQWFVISMRLNATFTWPYDHWLFMFFSFDSRWFRYITIEAAWDYEINHGLSIPISQFLNDVLRARRSFLLQFGQRRVCTRSSVWYLRGFFSLLKYESEVFGPRSANSLIFTYKHLCKSTVYPAGVLLNQPNLVFFTQFLSNPYFWQVLQQTLHSKYRY